MSPARIAAHPRSRGENVDVHPFDAGVGGSSPLTRGKRAVQDAHRIRFRLIPAHAGKTVDALTCRPAAQAHPRSRGENVI